MIEGLTKKTKQQKTEEVEILWEEYLAKKAECILAEKAKVAAKVAWSEACLKYHSTPKDN